MAIVFLPAPLRDLTGGTTSLTIEAATLGQVLVELESRFPGINDRLCRGEQIDPSLQVSIDGALSSRGLLAQLRPDSEVHFLPAIGGG